METLTKYHFLTVTAHFLNDSWDLTNLILFTSMFPFDSATADNISSELQSNLNSYYDVSERPQRCVFRV